MTLFSDEYLFQGKIPWWGNKEFEEMVEERFPDNKNHCLFSYISALKDESEHNRNMLNHLNYLTYVNWCADVEWEVMSSRMLRDMTSVAPLKITKIWEDPKEFVQNAHSFNLSKEGTQHWFDFTGSAPWRKSLTPFPISADRTVHVNVESADGNFLMYDRWHTLVHMNVPNGDVKFDFPITKPFKCYFYKPFTLTETEAYAKSLHENCLEVTMEKGSQLDLVYYESFKHDVVFHITYP